MKSFTAIGTLTVTLLLASSAYAAPGDMLVRVRAVNIDWSSSSSPVAGVAASNKTIPEADLTYFFTNNIATELILTYPQSVNINLNGAALGSVKALPPILTVQYHFMPDSTSFRPYVGAGLNYTNFSSVNLNAGSTPLSINKSSTGGALQAGFDIPISGDMSFNFDIKKTYIKTDVSTPAGYLTTLKLDPLLVSLGLGWKF